MEEPLAISTQAPPKRGETHPQHKPKKEGTIIENKKGNSVPKKTVIKKKKSNTRTIELLQYGITISSAFIGLTTTFYLNSIKTENDKKKHLVAVLEKYRLVTVVLLRPVTKVLTIYRIHRGNPILYFCI
ncbi:MAG TPA: hypothetical protein VGM30_19970 [Puia sp.]|jgi:hypothetical protein